MIKDRVGDVYGRLTVVEFVGMFNKRTKWRCRCVCGNYADVLGSSLETGHTKSCGCLHGDVVYRYTLAKYGGGIL
jgi:hypothetical protein